MSLLSQRHFISSLIEKAIVNISGEIEISSLMISHTAISIAKKALNPMLVD